jgi:hypothetical protein
MGWFIVSPESSHPAPESKAGQSAERLEQLRLGRARSIRRQLHPQTAASSLHPVRTG